MHGGLEVEISNQGVGQKVIVHEVVVTNNGDI